MVNGFSTETLLNTGYFGFPCKTARTKVTVRLER